MNQGTKSVRHALRIAHDKQEDYGPLNCLKGETRRPMTNIDQVVCHFCPVGCLTDCLSGGKEDTTRAVLFCPEMRRASDDAQHQDDMTWMYQAPRALVI
jgi:hypothetical protein